MDRLQQLLFLEELTKAPWFKVLTSAFAFCSLLLALALLIVCFLEYWKGFDRFREGSSGDVWFVVVSTLRDTFSISALYIILELVRGAVQYRDADPIQSMLVSFVSLFSPFFELLIFGFITYIVFRRLFILRNWLNANMPKDD